MKGQNITNVNKKNSTWVYNWWENKKLYFFTERQKCPREAEKIDFAKIG